MLDPQNESHAFAVLTFQEIAEANAWFDDFNKNEE